MKRKIILTLFYTYFFMTLFSCQSLLKVLKTDYSVPVTEDFETVKEKADRIVVEKDYIKKFNTSDKAGRKHTVIFLDTQYFSIDDEIYAYRFHNIMFYGPGLNLLKKDIYTLPDKMWGLQGFASSVRNPSLTFSFIFAKEFFGQKGYSSMYEASQINGVTFSSPKGETGYIDDFGNWKRHSYFDYFEQIFNTRNQDVKHRMYQAFELQ